MHVPRGQRFGQALGRDVGEPLDARLRMVVHEGAHRAHVVASTTEHPARTRAAELPRGIEELGHRVAAPEVTVNSFLLPEPASVAIPLGVKLPPPALPGSRSHPSAAVSFNAGSFNRY